MAVPALVDRPDPGESAALERRNRRTALVLVGWIVLLCIVSLIVIWVRN